LIAVVDYGAGNLGSVDKALRYLGVPAQVTADPDVVWGADALIVPGVGAFQHCMNGLQMHMLREPVLEVIRSGRPFLGICIGMQMLFTWSEEGGHVTGLDVIAGAVRRFPVSVSGRRLKVPHMGWNTLELVKECPLFVGLPERPRVYFVHSYYCEPADVDVVAARTDYGISFCSALQRENIFAVQFHPEKSGAVGLEVLRNFVALSS